MKKNKFIINNTLNNPYSNNNLNKNNDQISLYKQNIINTSNFLRQTPNNNKSDIIDSDVFIPSNLSQNVQDIKSCDNTVSEYCPLDSFNYNIQYNKKKNKEKLTKNYKKNYDTESRFFEDTDIINQNIKVRYNINDISSDDINIKNQNIEKTINNNIEDNIIGQDIQSNNKNINYNIIDLRDNEFSRLENSNLNKDLESNNNIRLDYLNRDFQNTNNLILPFPRGGNDTRKNNLKISTQIFDSSNNDLTMNNRFLGANEFKFNYNISNQDHNNSFSGLDFDDNYSGINYEKNDENLTNQEEYAKKKYLGQDYHNINRNQIIKKNKEKDIKTNNSEKKSKQKNNLVSEKSKKVNFQY